MATSFEKARNGRKFRMGLICILALTVGLAMVAFVSSLAGIYAIYAGGLGGLYAVYCGGNVANKFVLTRPGAQLQQAESSDQPEEKPDGME